MQITNSRIVTVTKDLDINSSCEFHPSRQALASALKLPVALAVIAAAFFDPDEPPLAFDRVKARTP